MKNKALSGVAPVELGLRGSGSLCSLHSIIHEERGNLALAYDLYGPPSRLHALYADDYPRAVICNSRCAVRECENCGPIRWRGMHAQEQRRAPSNEIFVFRICTHALLCKLLNHESWKHFRKGPLCRSSRMHTPRMRNDSADK